jgi:hypothetical protein
MISTRGIRLAWAALVIAAVSTAPARADLILIPQPDAAYVSSTSLFSFADPDFAVVASLSKGPITITPDIPLVALTVPGNWSSWGATPNTEGATPRVLWTNGLTSLTLDSSVALTTFGLEAQPDTSTPSTINMTFFSHNNQVGQFARIVDGNAGARLFAAQSTIPFDRVVLSSTDDFAIARVRLDASAIPEPSQVAMLVSVSLFALAVRLFHRATSRARSA